MSNHSIAKRILITLLITLGAALMLTSPTSANLNYFVITDFAIDYQLGIDDSGRSTLKTTEVITATFPNHDQNHGLERAIPTEYNGHPVRLTINEITDASGKTLPYSSSTNNKNLVLRIGDAKRFVHGQQTYRISYQQHDITSRPNDANIDEFYWNTNGIEWRVPINRLSVTLNLDDSIASRTTGATSCYHGSKASNDRCDLRHENPSKYTVTANNLLLGENVTIAVGFMPNTFAEYQPSNWEKFLAIWRIAGVVYLVLLIILLVPIIVHYYRRKERSAELNPIVAEYIPPENSSVSLASYLTPSAKTFAAQLIDLAVRHYIRIIETKPKTNFLSPAEYDIEIIKGVDDLRSEELEVLTDIFDRQAIVVGDRLALKSLRNNSRVARNLSNNAVIITGLARNKYKLRRKAAPSEMVGLIMMAVAAAIGVALFWNLIFIFLIILVISIVNIYSYWPLTDEGLALRRYLKGYKLYISVAEADRLAMLQSANAADKIAIDTADTAAIVKLYERSLGYAVLFGQEASWQQALGRYYETSTTEPDWITSASGSAFNAVAFSSVVSSFSSSVAYSAPSSSSSSGSSGGGFSGGGGGGGGGGGW